MQGVILGTAAYMVPEQARGKAVDKRTDIWAFGCVLYELLTGKQLYTGETAAETLASVIKETPDLSQLPADAPRAISNLIARCLEKDPRRRLQHIGEARIAIEDVLSGAASEAAEEPAKESSWHQPLAWMTLAAVLLVALAALAFVHFRETSPPVRTVRFQVAGPANATVTFFQISPDGQYLAFVAQKEGHTQVWVQPLSSTEPQALPGTEDASYPFWSRDSAYIAYFAEGKLNKIAATSGIPQILCDAPAGRGGAWSPDGVIVFAPNIGGPLYRVSAAGGVPAQVTKPESVPGNSDRYPEFLPGGHIFLYEHQTGKPETSGIYASSLEGMQPVRILPDVTNVRYVPSAPPSRGGYLLFRPKDTLMAQPFDSDRLKTTGDMFPVAEKVGTLVNVGNAAFSASTNGELAYRPGSVYDDRQFVWMDRMGKQLGAATKPATTNSGALSPDEKQIAIGISQDPTNGSISAARRYTRSDFAFYFRIWQGDRTCLVPGFEPRRF